MPFCIGTVIIGFILWYARVRNPMRRMRPPFGLLALAGIVLMMVNGGLAAFIAKAILTGDDIAKGLKEETKRAYDGRDTTLPPGKKDEGEKPMSSWDRLKYGDRNQEGDNSSEQ
ncbi:MAG: hypothetical protein ACKO2G_06345 [Verrucomicrobiales bacterium]